MLNILLWIMRSSWNNEQIKWRQIHDEISELAFCRFSWFCGLSLHQNLQEAWLGNFGNALKRLGQSICILTMKHFPVSGMTGKKTEAFFWSSARPPLMSGAASYLEVSQTCFLKADDVYRGKMLEKIPEISPFKSENGLNRRRLRIWQFLQGNFVVKFRSSTHNTFRSAELDNADDNRLI